MVPGTIIEGRYRLIAEAGRGGMGVVYRADDLEEGDICAVKVMRPKGNLSRFLRELDVLTCLQHPSIVALRSSGAVDNESPYFAMEWIDGVTLGHALARGPLDPALVSAVAAPMADALAYAHRLGVLHRDITPANVMLRAGDAARPCFIDFGLARRTTGDATLTGTDVRIGTPRYMPPEVVRGQPATSASDIYSLGCVLYECLTGEPAHTGSDVLSLLASIAIDRARDLGSHADRIPPGLRRLVERMLSKRPEDRPIDGHALCGELKGAAMVERPSVAPARPHAVSAVLGAMVAGLSGAAGRGVSLVANALADVGARHGAELTVLPDGAWVLFVPAAGDAVEVAIRACSLADNLALRPEIGAVAVTIGVTEAPARPSHGAIVARALAHLRSTQGRTGVWLDATAASLLGERVTVAGEGPYFRREEASSPSEASHAVLGDEREHLVARARAFIGSALRSGHSDVLLVTGPSGIGKSLLIGRALEGLAESHVTWSGRGDPVATAEPFQLLASLLVGGLRLPARLSPGALDGCLAAAGITRDAAVTAALAQLPLLRNDDTHEAVSPDRLAPRLTEAWLALVRDVTRSRPLVLLVEDGQWCDPASLDVLRRVLAASHGAPVCLVLATRGDGVERVQQALRGLAPSRVEVPPLDDASARRVAEHAAGGILEDATLASIVARSGGVPYFLRELACAHGRGDVPPGALPVTVDAVVRARLLGLGADARTVLSHAAILGEAATRAAVEIAGLSPARIDGALEDLVRGDLLLREGDERYRFRHGLVREAAELLFGDEARAAAHLRAAEWLTAREPQAHGRMALHFEAAGRSDLADPHALAVGLAAAQLGDMETARDVVTRCLARPLAPQDAARAHLIRALAAVARQDSGEAEHAAVEAMRLAPVAGSEYCRAAVLQLGVMTRTRGSVAARPVAQRLVSRLAAAATQDASVDGMMGLAANLFAFGQRDAARAAHLLASRLLARQPNAYADGLSSLYGFYEAAAEVRVADGAFSLEVALRAIRDAEARFESVAQVVMALQTGANVGWVLLELGDLDAAIGVLRGVVRRASDIGQERIARHARALLGGALSLGGRASEAEAVLADLVIECEADPFHRSMAAMYLAVARLGRGALIGAASAGEEAVALMETYRPEELPKGRGVLAAVWVCLGKPGRALELARRALEDHEGRALCWGDAFFARRVVVDALRGLGDESAAVAAAAELEAVLETRVAALAEPRLRAAYANHPSHGGFAGLGRRRASA